MGDGMTASHTLTAKGQSRAERKVEMLSRSLPCPGSDCGSWLHQKLQLGIQENTISEGCKYNRIPFSEGYRNILEFDPEVHYFWYGKYYVFCAL